MPRFQTRARRLAVRETVLLVLAAVASFLFVNHDNLYLNGPFALRDARIESYFLATAVIYLFLRIVILAAEMRAPRAHAELVRCPECGQWIDDPSIAGREDRHHVGLDPKASTAKAPAAVALRKAVEASQIGTVATRRDLERGIVSPPRAENLTDADTAKAVEDPDLLERLRHSPGPPAEPRLRR